jgi:hypothetical protein
MTLGLLKLSLINYCNGCHKVHFRVASDPLHFSKWQPMCSALGAYVSSDSQFLLPYNDTVTYFVTVLVWCA